MTENADQSAGEKTSATSTADDTQRPEFRPITSQEQFDEKVVDRLAKERAKFTDPSRITVKKDEIQHLREQAQKLAEIEAANKTELEKERDRATKAEQERDKTLAEAKEIRLRSAILAEAAKADRNVVDADAAISLLDRSSLTLDDQGNPTNLAEAMDSLLKAKPFLVASNGGTRGNADQGARPGGGPNQVTAAELKTMTPEQMLKAEQEGRLHSLMTGAA